MTAKDDRRKFKSLRRASMFGGQYQIAWFRFNDNAHPDIGSIPIFRSGG